MKSSNLFNFLDDYIDRYPNGNPPAGQIFVCSLKGRSEKIVTTFDELCHLQIQHWCRIGQESGQFVEVYKPDKNLLGELLLDQDPTKPKWRWCSVLLSIEGSPNRPRNLTEEESKKLIVESTGNINSLLKL